MLQPHTVRGWLGSAIYEITNPPPPAFKRWGGEQYFEELNMQKGEEGPSNGPSSSSRSLSGSYVRSLVDRLMTTN